MNNIKKQAHILVVDDDNRILKLLKKFLQQNDFLVSTATSSNDAVLLLQNFKFDLMILDIMMPETTGLDFLRDIRANQVQLPVMLLTALSEPEDRIMGLEMGANDYLSKPFAPRELLLRINNLLVLQASSSANKDQLIRFGNATYNPASKELIVGEELVLLSNNEEKLLELLIGANNQPISRDFISENFGGLNLRSIDVQVIRLRNKIELDPKKPVALKTIRNNGYVLYTL
jgi:two-component system phosphate regulon response regulator OmpR